MTLTPRTLWQLYEPFHALTYFAPECQATYEAAGLRGFWRGYFAGRAAPLGPVGVGPVTATFFGFRPDFVARAVPSIWTLASPDTALRARFDGIDEAVRRIYADVLASDTFTELAALARAAIDGCDAAGRPLFAANADLEWPAEPHLALWHATTLLREHRGDGHVASLVVAGLDPCEAHVTQVAANGAPLESIKPYRGWNDEDWSAASQRLSSRGLLAQDDGLTTEGELLRTQVEDDTDRLALEPLDRLGPAGAGRFAELMRPLVNRLVATETIPYPNPIGVQPPAELDRV